MKKLNTAPISGMQELLPPEQATFNQFKYSISQTFSHHGYQNIETPIIDRTEILLAKAGGDTEKQIYKVVKTAESALDADQALRFDHTVPLARYVVEHQNDLAFPFKVSQIGRNFRGERPQKGRYREFYQCDIDVIGRNTLPLAYDADIIFTLYEALQAFQLPPLRIRLSNRKLLTGLLEELRLTGLAERIFNIIDHAEKVPPEKTLAALSDLGISDNNIDILSKFMHIKGNLATILPRLTELNVANETFQTGLSELTTVLGLLENRGLLDTVIADLLIIRGLDYYTGTVFETNLVDYLQLGSICSGGRYENLAGNFTDQHLPGVGGSIGLTRLFYVLNENNLLKSQIKSPVDIAIIPISEQEYDYSYQVSTKLQTLDYITDVILTDKKLGDKISYASKIARQALIIGENEVKTGELTLKDLVSGEKNPLTLQ